LIAPAVVVLFAFVSGASLFGQGLGVEQMSTMRSVVDRACVDALGVHVDADAPNTD